MNSPTAQGGARSGHRHWQLPAEVSGFVGRDRELAQLADLLTVTRLVTVTGPGGVGKTRLALRAAAEAAYSGGICLVELSRLSDPELLPDAAAQCLKLQGLGLQHPGPQHADAASRLDAVLSELRVSNLLLILDTCEHLTAACARFVTTVLRETNDVKILATSRQPLHAPGEEVLRLGPLPVRDDAGAPECRTGDAVTLFAQRAAAAVGGFTLAAADLPHVVSLCQRLDGIPLAIELAAVRVRALPVAELAGRIEAGIAAETGTRRGGTSRHQTLEAAIGWSYGLCTDAEKTAWRRLSVFTGSFDVAVARDVVAGGDMSREQADVALSGLVDKSVVLPACAGRYRLLHAVREYGAARLAQTGEDAACRERRLARYLSLAREFSHRLAADGQQQRLDRLRAEHENLLAALSDGLADSCREPGAGRDAPRAGAADRTRAAARLAAALCPYWIMSGSIREGMHWQDRALSAFAAPSPQRAGVLASRALLGTAIGAPEAISQASEAVALAASAGDERTHARSYLALQLALTTAGRYAEALEAAKRVRWLLEALGAEHELRALEAQLAFTHVHAGNCDAAIEHCQRLLRGLNPGERWLRGNAHILSALAYYQQPGRRDECARAASTGLRETLEVSNPIGGAYSVEVLAWLAADEGRCQRAAWLLGAAQALWERNGGRLSGSAVFQGYHDRSAAIAESSLGAARYNDLHKAGSTRPLGQIAALALSGSDLLPEFARPLPAGEDASAWPGGEGLTAREREIVVLVASGLSNRDVAARLVISKRTVDAHVNHIFAKLGLSSRVQLAIWLHDRTRERPDELSETARACT